MNKECKNCIKRKSMLCPNSSECYFTKDKPYYRETDSDFEIELIEENKQLKEKINKAIEYIKETEVYNEEGGKGWLYELDYFDELLEILEVE